MGTIFMWPFSPASLQFLGEHPKEKGLFQEEMVAGKHPQREGNTRLSTPGLKIAIVHSVILQAAKRGDGAVQRRLGRVHVGFVHRKVCPQERKHDLH